jgi:hypothetical protein
MLSGYSMIGIDCSTINIVIADASNQKTKSIIKRIVIMILNMDYSTYNITYYTSNPENGY